ncbi:MAG: hypothetical protein PHE27_01765 [Alphaproteobacteria bacterium]|nr:hypothetical protein [Alphaproteobacteria bacterium]
MQKILRAGVRRAWPNLANESILALSCGELLIDPAQAVFGRMTSAQDETFSCLVDSRGKPLADGSRDRVVALHTDIQDSLLREIWRVLKGEGRLLLIVPHAGSFWASSSASPFGEDPSFSPKQIKTLLNKNNFHVYPVGSALFTPPALAAAWPELTENIEKIISIAPLFYGGALIVDAQKRIYGAATCGAKNARRKAETMMPPLPLPI